MSSNKNIKCKNCGSSDIEVRENFLFFSFLVRRLNLNKLFLLFQVDSARGDAVCTNCGSVLEDNIIVSEVQFEEGAHGASNAVGQFVSSESKGGATGYGKFHVGSGQESREVTLRKAKTGITHLCHQLSLNNHCIETACNFFKMALSRHLTRGRRNTHIYAACVYITCRTEGTSHLLIDISDVLQICCYELGRTYLKLSQALCINIPSIDPCIYIMRFANKLELGEKTHEVSMTAQRLVQRMKKDSIHSGRRPSGLCGAALLLASRMHDFNRTPNDMVKIVKIHESTLRKRLIEFGETPSSALTLDEFMTVDLEAEQDPPAFKAARKKDKERILRLGDADTQLSTLQIEIEAALDKNPKKRARTVERQIELADVEIESTEASKFIEDEMLAVIEGCLSEDPEALLTRPEEQGQRPDLAKLCLPPPIVVSAPVEKPPENDEGLLDLTGINDDELDGYIMTAAEAAYKDQMWNKLNAEYLTMVKEREQRLAKEREEGKPEKKKRRTGKRKAIGPSNTAGEAIEKMLQEKKISNKINYDILKTLTEPKLEDEVSQERSVKLEEPAPVRRSKPNLPVSRRRPIATLPSTSKSEEMVVVEEQKPIVEVKATAAVLEDDDFESEPEPEPVEEHSSLRSMLDTGGDEDYYGYDDY